MPPRSVSIFRSNVSFTVPKLKSARQVLLWSGCWRGPAKLSMCGVI